MDNLPTIRNLYRRSAGLNFFRATLGDENGVIDEPGRAGYVRIRYTQAAGLGKATTVRFRAVVQKTVGMPVEVGYDTDGELAVLRADFAAQEATGINPLGNNPADDNVSYFVNQSQITTALCHPVSSAADSMLVTVEPVLYVLDGTLHFFLGGDGDGATPIDLTASIPGTANKQCAACLFLDVTTDTIEIQTSTPIDITDDLTTTDVQECITASTAGSLPIHAWRLYNGQTGINPTDIPSGGDNFLDLRQLINVITDNASGGTTSFNAAGDSGTPQAITDGNTLTIAGGTGLSSVASATDTVTLNLDNTAVTPGSYTNMSGTVDAQGRLTAASSGAAPISTSYWRNRARLCSNAPMSVTSAPATIDGVTAVTGDRILVVGQGNPNKAQNGLWVYQGSGNPMTRPTDYAAGSTTDAFTGITVYVEAGDTLAQAVFLLTTTGTITIDTTVTLWSDLNLVGTTRAQDITNKNIGASVVGDGITLNNNSTSQDVIVKGASDPNTLYVDTSANSVGVGTATPAAKFQVEGSVIINDAGADIDVRIESDTDSNNFFSDGGNNNIGIGTGTPDASAKLQVVSTSKGSIPAPVMTASQRDAISSPVEGLLAYASDTDELSFYDSQRWRAVESVGWTPFAYPASFNPQGAFTTAIALTAQYASLAVPMVVQTHMLLESVSVRNTNTTNPRTWGWNLYKQYLNNGNSGENTLTQIAAASANETFTPGAASTRTITAGSAPVYLAPGVYWLVIQNRHATNAFSVGSDAVSTQFALNTGQTKDTGSSNGTTLDFVSATWSAVTAIIAARLNGRVFGQTTAF